MSQVHYSFDVANTPVETESEISRAKRQTFLVCAAFIGVVVLSAMAAGLFFGPTHDVSVAAWSTDWPAP